VRLLLDEQVPVVFADELPSYEVHAVQAMGWSGIENGELLRIAADAGFDVLVTLDKGIEFQQNLAALPMSVLVIKARSNRIEDLERLAKSVLEAIESIQPRTLVHVG
jgi:predicted nuclease of predicted toxin-antitoxin system